MSAETMTETLRIERVFKAPIEKVFAAWTNIELIAQWFGPEGFSVVEVESQYRPNGKYSITIEAPDKTHIKHFGEYLEIDEPNTLIFTWVLENQACQGSASQHATTLVELNFIAHKEGTLLKLQHEKLPDSEALNGHRFGWLSSFDCLEKILHI